MTDITQGSSVNQTFILVSSTDHISPLLGATPIVLLSQNGGAFAPATGSVSEIGDGWYVITLSTTDTSVIGILSFHVTATGGDNTDFFVQVVPAPTIVTPLFPVIPEDQAALYAGFVAFVQNVVGINSTILPTTSPTYSYAFLVAISIVNQTFSCAFPQIYDLMVYNLGASNILNYGQDLPGAAVYQNGMPYFAFMRQQFGINAFVSGVLQSQADASTSSAVAVPEALKNLTLADLQYLKDPYGRQYLAFAQRYGTMWGMN